MPTTTDGFPYPAASDPLSDGAQAIQDLAEFLDAEWTPWTVYVPALTGVTLGNGVLAGMYRTLFGKVDFRVSLKLGTTSVITGTISLGLPAGLSAAETDAAFEGFPICRLLARDSSSGVYRVGFGAPDVAANKVYLYFDSAVQEAETTTPFTWANGDTIKAHGSYRTV